MPPDHRTASTIWSVARNIGVIATKASELEVETAIAVDELTAAMKNLLVHETDTRKRSLPLSPLPSTPRCSKRQRPPSISTPLTPITRASSPTPSDPPSDRPNGTKEPDHSVVRSWFLNHISHPYPTSSQKETLAKAAGITKNKVDSDLTNFRRRSGWTDLMNRFCASDREKMRKFIDKVEAGKERRDEVLMRVKAMKEYLGGKEGERVGDWVQEVTALTSSLIATGSTTSSEFENTLNKHRSNVSLSSLSAASNVLGSDTPRSVSTSSSFSTSSSLSDASFTLPSKKRLNPNAEPFIPNKRHTSRNGQSATHTHAVNYDPSIWSTSAPLPVLPHMSSSSSNAWSIPSDSVFQPRIEDWSEGSVSGVSRVLQSKFGLSKRERGVGRDHGP
ncbi:uncharacterized protein IL334_004544 [Kwoniella shivajii]|uniref:KN homeodomain domain-containing protein n=1 Tax=Kwoniella shivajii TaxID=564305 RepID=A0ABZ1D4M6_9TREE|nr:hypothetical protein IL334_004544 [Kwoniella shivajii]